ncbi:isochorismatase family protein [uncultured Amnibacterium sp.]|uniref:isochorismatase family protein n=1 Tax=uncultured Amnibacterium sp. TaxID=1631851 RepID=UPI0035CA474B
MNDTGITDPDVTGTDTTGRLAAGAALIVIDVQRGFEQLGPRDNPDCEANVAALLAEWRRRGEPIVIVQHDSDEPGSPLAPGDPGHELKDVVTGDADLRVHKRVHSAFHGDPDLHGWLQSRGLTAIAICGIQTNACCETTARVGSDLGYDVTFVLDAMHTLDKEGPDGVTVSAAEQSRATGIALHEEFATVVRTADLLTA